MVFKGAKMNLGFFVQNTSQASLNSEIFSLLNDSVENHTVNDATLFYNEIDFNPALDNKKFGLFNATEMWSFTGTLVVSSLNLLPLAAEVVNKIKIVYLYTKDNFQYGDIPSVMDLISLPDEIKRVARSEEDAKEYKRLTGKDIEVIKAFNAKEILEV
tara:strand:- start:3867 stop:4340 length:474 start_codon:yes stop_codon:yes gene_type:complete